MMRLGSFFPLLLAVAVSFANVSTHGHADTPRQPWTTSRITGLPTAPPAYKIVPAFPHLSFDHPTSVTQLPGTDRLLVTQMDGKIFLLPDRRSDSPATLIVDLKGAVGASVMHAAFHPSFLENRYIFLSMGRAEGGNHRRVSRFTMTDDETPRLLVETEQLIIKWPAGGHSGGCLHFGSDGYLYISTGDGSGPNPPDGRTTGQDTSDLLGAILRLDVDHPQNGEGYSIPDGNPFPDRPGTRPEIFGYGLRNPWKFGIDPESNDLFVADNGWETWESVYKVESGTNCGWPIMEGRARLRTEVPQGPTPITPPVTDHPHSEANSVIGGEVYRGDKLTDLRGRFVYGDYITGTIWSLAASDGGGYEHTTLVDTDLRIVAFTQTDQGELLVLDYDFSGQLYEIVPSGLRDTSNEFPRWLSQTGLFTSLEELSPAPGVLPYSVIVDRWTDGSAAQRWVAIPRNGSIQLATNRQDSEFPDGTVFAKQLNMPREDGSDIRLETQLLHYEHGQWNTHTYRWNDEGTDAELVDPTGGRRELELTINGEPQIQTWHFSAVNECRLCHNANAGNVLGFTSKQLNHIVAGTDANQLDLFASQRVISGRPANSLPGLVNPHDDKHDIDSRARSYLHTNCAMCHHKGGSAIVSFYLHRDYPFSELRTNKGTGIGTFGIQDAKLIVPGDAFSSILNYRMSKLGYGRMPYIGSRVVDSRGVALINSWINSMEHGAAPVSDAATATSVLANALQQLIQPGSGGDEPNRELIDTLLKTTEGTLSLTARLHGGEISDANRAYLRETTKQGLEGDIRGLLDHFLPESDRRKTLGANPDPQTILELVGDTDRGELIFLSDNARCRTCHDASDPAKSLGPTMVDIRKKYQQKPEMLKHILNPSQQADDKFATWTAVTDEGQSVTGLLIERTDRGVTLKTAERKTIQLDADAIESMEKSTRSLMPDGILSDLTPQEAADLLAYLRGE